MAIDNLPWIKAGNKITIILPNGQSKTVTDGDSNYESVLNCIKISDWDKIISLLDTKTAIFNFSDGVFEVINNIVHVEGKPVPNGLSKKIIEFAKEDLPYKPLLNFWDKLNKNPSFSVVQSLYEFLERNEYPITKEGDIIAYKGVKADWTDCHTGTIVNSIGSTISMPRNEVDNNPDKTCSYGFHIGNFGFSWNYGASGHMIMVSVNPENVVSMPNAYDFSKMRVCEYTILSEVTVEEKGNLYKTVDKCTSSDYIDHCSDDDDQLETDSGCDCYNYSCDEYNAHHNSCLCCLLENKDDCDFELMIIKNIIE